MVQNIMSKVDMSFTNICYLTTNGSDENFQEKQTKFRGERKKNGNH